MKEKSRAKQAPRGLKKAGKTLWHSINDTYALETHEELVLIEACRIADRLDDLAKAQADAPLTVRNVKGDEVASPYLVEARQQQVVFVRLLASLRLPTGDEEDLNRPQRRSGARGAYGIRGAA